MNIPLYLQARVSQEIDLRENLTVGFSLSSIPAQVLIDIQHHAWNGFKEQENSYWDTLLESFCFNPKYLNDVGIHDS